MSSPALPGQSPQTPTSSTAAYFTDSYIFNWANRTFRDDLIFVPPIALCLGTGLLSHHPAAGMIAAGGAVTVGFGAKQSIDDSPLLPMLFVSLGILFVARIALLKYRLQIPGFELPEPARVAQQEFDNRIANLLDGMANRMEDKAAEVDAGSQDPLDGLEETIRTHCSEGPQGLLPAQMETFLALSRSVESVTMSLDKDIGSAEPVGSSRSSAGDI